jgi:phosphatidate cytidylyltransferase
MALHLATFKTRTLTAAVFVVVMLAGLLWNHWSCFILFSVRHFGCWWEYQRLLGMINKDYAGITPFHKYGVMIAGWGIMLYFTNDAFQVLGLSLHEIGWWLGLVLVFVLPLVELLFASNIHLKNIAYSAAGLIYISLSLGLMMDLRCQGLGELFGRRIDYGWIVPLVIIASIWVNDTMAYIVGSLIGKTPFSKISPKNLGRHYWRNGPRHPLYRFCVCSLAHQEIQCGTAKRNATLRLVHHRGNSGNCGNWGRPIRIKTEANGQCKR